jgi:hypothetical protein
MKTTMTNGPRTLMSLAVIAVGSCAFAACGDDESGVGGAGGAGSGGAGTTAAQSSGSPASTTGTTASTTTSGPGGGEGGTGDGGAGQGGSGGDGVGGAGGGEPGACFAADDFADLFALETDALCVVARYDAPGFVLSSYGVQPTWGAHGGLLTGDYLTDLEDGPITAIEVTRWSMPMAVEGLLAAETIEVDLTDLLADDASFGGAQIIDVGDGTSAFAYTGADFFTEGGLVFFDEEGAIEVDLLIGGFGLGVDPSTGLPIYSALAPLQEVEAGSAGLFGTVPCDEGGLVCGGTTHAEWGDSTGPVAVDEDGNVFAVMTSFDGTQTARGFSSTEIELGTEVDGTDLFTVDGFGSPLAALAPTAAADGLLVYQATNDETFLPETPIFVPFAEGDVAIGPTGEPAVLLTPAVEGAAVSFVADGEGRIWVGVGTDGGTTFAVLARP